MNARSAVTANLEIANFIVIAASPALSSFQMRPGPAHGPLPPDLLDYFPAYIFMGLFMPEDTPTGILPELKQFPVLVKSFLFRRHASLLSKMPACSSVRYCQLCGGRFRPMEESSTGAGSRTGFPTSQAQHGTYFTSSFLSTCACMEAHSTAISGVVPQTSICPKYRHFPMIARAPYLPDSYNHKTMLVSVPVFGLFLRSSNGFLLSRIRPEKGRLTDARMLIIAGLLSAQAPTAIS